MKDKEIQIENKLKSQVEHIFEFYEKHELKEKMYDLAFEWYMKGVCTGVEHGGQCKYKNEE